MDREPLGALARQAQAGDAAARTALLVELYTIVRKQVMFLLDHRASAEDAVQDTMLAIHRGLSSFRGDADVRTWAITIAMRTAYRQRRRDRRVVATAEVPDTGAFDVDQRAGAEMVLLHKALARLAPKKRDAFVLMGLFDLSAKDAGKALGTFANTAASRFRHARAELEEMLQSGALRQSREELFDEDKVGMGTNTKDPQP